MAELASWLAPIATMVAAVMTAANLGPRLTGAGFAVFAVGACAWCIVALQADQTGLLLTNVFLLVVDVIGVWRWLGRARYAEAARRAAKASASRSDASLFSFQDLLSASVVDRGGTALGPVIDAMGSVEDGSIAYLVVSDGGVAGVGEVLRRFPADRLAYAEGKVIASIPRAAFEALPAIEADRWPLDARHARSGIPEIEGDPRPSAKGEQ
ncbi:PRC-barrel domain containing protein [Novosphingobium sp. NBM11]|uniref:PRC-barrel domain-containing protein n=1 Tax=Novosphingobium sp. NBM11 TaxID=2596914 RepID=UPI00189202C9|nr:PRC-barrel domain-containing protein [Novosphingobium sp. NBM11]MBF5089474.1 PRC-barrel domain containing protein [Novosphingobium sp. NBM11]